MHFRRMAAWPGFLTATCRVLVSTVLFIKQNQVNIINNYMGMGQNLVPLVNIKIAGKWMFIPLKMVLIGIDPYPYG